MLDRRQLLGSAASVGALAAFPGAARAQTAPRPPVARIATVTEMRFGVTMADPYRWMENDKDPEWEPFMRGQAAAARARLDALPRRAALLARISALSGDTPAATNVQEEAGKLFYELRPAGANVFKLYLREAGKDRLLVDPETFKDASGASLALDYWSASPDARHVAFALAASGSENSVVRVLEVATGRVLPETIDRAQYGSPSWLPDSSAFFLLRRKEGAVLGAADYYADETSWLHRIGTDPKSDRLVFNRATSGGIAMGSFEFPIVQAKSGCDYAVLMLLQGVRREKRLFVAPLADVVAGKPRWVPVCESDDRVTEYSMRPDALYLLSEKGADMGRVLAVDPRAPDLVRARVAMPESKVALEYLMSARDGVYVTVMDGGNQRFRRIGLDGRVTDVAMPFAAGVYGAVASLETDGFYARISGWLTPPGIWRYDPAKGVLTDTGLSPKPAVDLTPFEAISTFATARDGTKIPVSIVAKKGVKRDGSAPLLADAYGSYQFASTPALNLRELAFLEAGGVLATVGVRGGGEYGRPWHEAGKKATKANTWRDMIDACRFLIAERWTSSPRLAIIGGSAGGITVGRALTEAPELFGLVISAVGVSNPVRGEVEQNNGPNIPEFGSAKVEADFGPLLAMDSYMAVKDGTRYPMVILTTGMTDPRVAPWHAAKMAARLQAATTSGKPVILRVDFEAGHGMGSTRAQGDALAADTQAAVLALAG